MPSQNVVPVVFTDRWGVRLPEWHNCKWFCLRADGQMCWAPLVPPLPPAPVGSCSKTPEYSQRPMWTRFVFSSSQGSAATHSTRFSSATIAANSSGKTGPDRRGERRGEPRGCPAPGQGREAEATALPPLGCEGKHKPPAWSSRHPPPPRSSCPGHPQRCPFKTFLRRRRAPEPSRGAARFPAGPVAPDGGARKRRQLCQPAAAPAALARGSPGRQERRRSPRGRPRCVRLLRAPPGP